MKKDSRNPGPGGRPLRVVFLCYANACRSQMAEAYARVLGGDLLEPLSAGVRPLGFIPEQVATVMEEEGISIEGQFSKSMHELTGEPIDLIVDLAGVVTQGPKGIPVDSRPVFDPYGGDLDDFRKSRRAVLETVKSLIEDLRVKKEET